MQYFSNHVIMTMFVYDVNNGKRLCVIMQMPNNNVITCNLNFSRLPLKFYQVAMFAYRQKCFTFIYLKQSCVFFISCVYTSDLDRKLQFLWHNIKICSLNFNLFKNNFINKYDICYTVSKFYKQTSLFWISARVSRANLWSHFSYAVFAFFLFTAIAQKINVLNQRSMQLFYVTLLQFVAKAHKMKSFLLNFIKIYSKMLLIFLSRCASGVMVACCYLWLLSFEFFNLLQSYLFLS